jgi:hypothetical protein
VGDDPLGSKTLEADSAAGVARQVGEGPAPKRPGALGCPQDPGGSNDDILIGTTSFNANIAVLDAIMAEWGSADSYTTRVSDLSVPTGGANGSTFLKAGTVANDSGAPDGLKGNAGTDGFFSSTGDVLQDNQPGETVTII